jgi:hypothetical protein
LGLVVDVSLDDGVLLELLLEGVLLELELPELLGIVELLAPELP